MLSFLLIGSRTNAQSLELDWAIDARGSGPFPDYAHAVAQDSAGNVYFYGVFNDTLHIGAGDAVLVESSYSDTNESDFGDAFLLKYNALGILIWAKVLQGSFKWQSYGKSLAIDPSGGIIITGCFQYSSDFDPGPGVALLTATPAADIYQSYDDLFIAKYDLDGNYMWAKCIGGNYVDRGEGVAVGSSGNIYVTGGYHDSADFDPGPGTAMLYATEGGHTDVFIAKYDTEGNYLWAQRMGGGSAFYDHGCGLALDQDEQVYVTGTFSGQATFSSSDTILTASGWLDGFVMKHDSAGNFLWVIAISGIGDAQVRQLVIDPTGNVYITGIYNGNFAGGIVDFDPGPDSALFVAPGFINTGFLAKYDAAGNFIWANVLAGDAGTSSITSCVDADDLGNVYICGEFKGIADFDPGPGVSNLFAITEGNITTNSFIAKYEAATGAYLWAGTLPAATGSKSNAVDVNASGTLYMAGRWSDSVDLDPGPGSDWHTAPPHEGNDVFLVKLGCSGQDTGYVTGATCTGNFTLNGVTYTASGTYIQHLPNAVQCDSTILLDLVMQSLEPPLITVDEFVLGTATAYQSYQWIKDNIALPGETNSTLPITENGDYQVSVINAEGCEATSAVYTVENVGIGDPYDFGNHLHVYPNPASEMINIECPVPVNITLMSMEGCIVRYVPEAEKVSLSGLAAGIYLLRITDIRGSLLTYRKIVKQRK